MLFDRRQEAGFEIVATATEVVGGRGYVASVAVIHPGTGERGLRVIFHDDALSDGFVFADPKAALEYAINAGYRALGRYRSPG